MVSFLKSLKGKEKEKEAEASKAERPATPPPTYDDATLEPPAFDDEPPAFDNKDYKRDRKGSSKGPSLDVAALTATFANLRLGTQKDPDVDTCLAHLKLLFAIQTLKDDTGFTDGLWSLWDIRADTGKEDADGPSEPKMGRKTLLSKIREKRWALYLARAADRYATWWKLLPGERLTDDVMEQPDCPRYTTFPVGTEDFAWTEDNLPPLDVLMVLHTHMLNPRAFLEDAMRSGLRTFWTTGMPWALVNAAIDATFSYTVSEACRANWVATTGTAWNNVDDSMTRFLECPACKSVVEVPWTTCGLPETYKGSERPGLIGAGYGDGDFSQLCTAGCGTTIDKKLLSVAKFIQDADAYVNSKEPMPASIIHPQTGMPEPALVNDNGKTPASEITFPNRIVKRGIYSKLSTLITPGMAKNPTMGTVRNLLAAAIAARVAVKSSMPASYVVTNEPSIARGIALTITERFGIRKMMSRYWENFSPFALDLVAAVIRQGVFIDKMCKIDWLHSPAARSTMDRLIQKYHRFVLIMVENPVDLAVPTLDVDLAWHTHQLAPRAYYDFTTRHTASTGLKIAKFIDHNDKVDEDKLNMSFEWTCKKYLDMFGEVYSECTCWHCEAIRIVSSEGPLFGKSKAQKVIDEFHKSPLAASCNYDAPVHISAHNAVKSSEAASRHYVRAHARVVWQARLRDAHEKAAKRAAKKGRKLPPKEVYHDHWDEDYYLYGPWVYPLYLAPGMYYAWDPGFMKGGTDGWSACVQGTCGQNDAAAGGCGGAGGCTTSSGYWNTPVAYNPSNGYMYAGCGGAGGAGGGGGCGGGGGG